MKIQIAKNPAFCYGVQRAYDLAKKSVAEKVYMLGPLIHNPQIVAELEEKGICIVEQVNDLQKDDTIIIRAHGISNKLRNVLCKKGVKIVDGTCPFVTKAHVIAQKFVENCLQLVIIGDQNHPEIRGIYEDFPEAIVIKNLDDVETLQCNVSTSNCLGVICQTTIKEAEASRTVEKLREVAQKVIFKNTICNATHEKQKAAHKLAKQMDVMLVVGGKNSNNTKMLWEICQKACPSYLISDISELKQDWFKGIEQVGITGGASTPLWLVEQIKEAVKKI